MSTTALSTAGRFPVRRKRPNRPAVMEWSPPSPKRHQSAKVEIATFH